MSNFGFTQSRFLPLLLLTGAAGCSLALAEGDLARGMKSKQLVDEMQQQVSDLRADTEKKIAYKRERAIEDLEKLVRHYRSLKKVTETDSILAQIALLKKKMQSQAELKQQDNDVEPDKKDSGNQFFEYDKGYLFDEKGIISGRLIFSPDHKVRAVYTYEDKVISESWDWKDMGDHVQISAGPPLGTVIISECPQSNLKSLLIRWGGKLTNILTFGHSELN